MEDAKSREPLPDGLHVGLSMADHVAEKALSGGAFKVLLTEPAGLWWESDANPLYVAPEPSSRRHYLRGHAVHAAVLEGIEEYEAGFVIKPEGVMTTLEDLKDFLRAKRAEHEAKLGPDVKLSRDEAKPYLMTGDRADLIARVRALDPEARIWDAESESRAILLAEDDEYVRVVQRFISQDPAYAPHLSGGVAELSYFWTEDGVRYKIRPDFLNPQTVLDLKSYGRAPRRGQSLRQHCVREIALNGADLQAVHNHRGVMRCAAEYASGKLQVHAHGEKGRRLAERAEQVISAIASNEEPPLFRWLYVRMGGAPTAIMLPFRTTNSQWAIAEQDIEDAVDIFKGFRETCGAGIWMASVGEVEIDDYDWPQGMMREPS